MRVVPLGDLAAYVELSRTLDLDVNALVQRLAAGIHQRALPEVRDVVPALGGLALHFSPEVQGDLLQWAETIVVETARRFLPDEQDLGRSIEVPVCYDDEFAPDAQEVCKRISLDKRGLIEKHSAAEYRVLMIGFAPGHAYMWGLDAKLSVPRRATPRALVPAGSVAIANRQCVVYPYAISGGWSVIGRTPLVVFDAARRSEDGGPSLFAAGDRVRFTPVSREEFTRLEGRQ